MKTVVMAGRRRWIIGGAIGLSRDYAFKGGTPEEVTDEDAAILLALTDGHEFALAQDPAAAAILAEGEARAQAAATWQAPGKCCDDDVVAEVDEGEAAPEVDATSTAGAPDVGTNTTAGSASLIAPRETRTAGGGTFPSRDRSGGPAGRK